MGGGDDQPPALDLVDCPEVKEWAPLGCGVTRLHCRLPRYPASNRAGLHLLDHLGLPRHGGPADALLGEGPPVCSDGPRHRWGVCLGEANVSGLLQTQAKEASTAAEEGGMTADRTLMRANTIREGGFHRKIIMKLN